MGIGLAPGIPAMGRLTLLGSILGTVTYKYAGVEWQLIPVILPLFIQCTAEEILLRAYVPAAVRERHNRDVVCLVSGTLFIIHHMLNMIYYGFSVIFCLNVFLMRVLFYLLVRAVSPVHSHPCYMTGNITINRAGTSG